ncbi:enoyl-CoA hydratase/isomerase family protein [Flexivirga alba]|uniref:3-hydroxyisobutyryl-CoA hydrolase n=1 Tax=Flexivirga alba TaxID=702742 RepID=A0ABW2AJZ9_9MICO
MTSTRDAAEPTVLVRVEGSVGRLTLNRPRAINALNAEMVDVLQRNLDEWASDPAITAVVLDGAGERGLCAGGDVVAMHSDSVSGGTEVLDFWRAEYLLNHAISQFPKPYVAIMDGIVMGGGVGVSAHGNTRIVTERSRIAMPETGIGFVPDVGGIFLLAHAPGETGAHLGLTAGQMDGADAIALGFADHFVPSSALDTFTAAVVADGVDAAILAYAETPHQSKVFAARTWIDEVYDADTVEEIAERLGRRTEPDAQAAAAALAGKSPTALKATLRSLREARATDSLEDVLNQDFRAVSHALRTHDLAEGIRAQVIDKDRNPRWSPATLAEVDAAMVDAYFAPVDHELGLGRN